MTWTELLTASNADIIAAGKIGTLKEYLKIDGDYDDSVLIQCVKAAVQYIIDAVGEFPETVQTAEILLYAIVQNLYENRELMQMDVQQRKRMEYTYGSMVLQLQLKCESEGE